MEIIKKFNLDNGEFHCICDTWNGTLHNLSSINWKEEIISNLLDAIKDENLHIKWDFEINQFSEKFTSYSEKKIIELIIEVEKFWSTDESIYNMFGLVSPTQKSKEILN